MAETSLTIVENLCELLATPHMVLIILMGNACLQHRAEYCRNKIFSQLCIAQAFGPLQKSLPLRFYLIKNLVILELLSVDHYHFSVSRCPHIFGPVYYKKMKYSLYYYRDV